MPGAPYNLRVRRLRPSDVPAITRFLPKTLIDCQGRSIAVNGAGACEALLADGVMTGPLLTSVEDGKEIVLAVGAAVFVTDEFLLSEKSAPQPGLPERFLHSALKPATPVLSLPEICRDNERHGLNVVIVLH